MKNIIFKFLTIIVLLFANLGFAQDVRMEGNSKTYLETMDSLLTNIDKQKITTGILYNRVMSFTELPLQTNVGERRVYDAGYFIQSWSELNRASYQPSFMTIEELKTLNNLTSSRDSLAVNIGIINTKMNYIDYGSTANPSIIIENGYFKTTTALDPFIETQVTIIAPLKSTVYAKIVKFKLLPELILQLSGKRIKNIEADFATGVQYNLVQNFVTNNAFMEVTYETSGSKTILFHLTYDDDSTETLTATINVNIPLTAMGVPPDCLAQNFVGNEGINATTSSNMAFQGYNETVPSKGKIEYRTYYNKVTNTCGNPLKIVKPIIILDGYDPGDKRKIYTGSVNYNAEDKSLYELMTYIDNGDLLNLVDKLRSAPYGFDVTLVNFPNGADYIERNAMALVALISRERAKLIANSSTEQISIIGPSMGGLVSRYALAYMEKNNIPHNTKLWVSFDSPHLGANIPMSAQDCIYFFGYDGAQDDAKTQFNENFRSPAGRQMLIEQLDNKHEAAPYPSILWNSNVPSGRNNQSPFRQQFQNSLISNGVAGSDGYPQNLRKIALINGSTNGTKVFTEKQKYLELAGFIKIKWGQIFGTSFITRIKGISFENRYMATFDDWSQTFKGYVIVQSEFASYGKTLTRRNINPRGSMDNVPGGLFPIGKVLQESFDKGLDDMPIINERQWRVNLKNSAFIPSVSALAFKNPNFNWSNSLNRNLVCDPNNKEIYFDSYFAPSKNEEHVLVTAESANWLIKELQGIPQAPSYPINANSLTGPELICTSASYSFGDICKLPSNATWTRSPNLQITSSNGFSVNVAATPTGSGVGFIKATFQNGDTFTKNVWVGKPQITTIENCFLTQAQASNTNVLTNVNDPGSLPCNPACKTYYYNPVNSYYVPFTGFVEQIEIEKFNTNFEVVATSSKLNIMPHTVGFVDFRFRAVNSCGATEWLYFKQKIENCGTQPQVNVYSIFPNPSNNIVNVALRDLNSQPSANTTVTGELYDLNGQPKATVRINNNQASFSVAGLPRGIYVLNIYFDGKVEGHQISVE